MAEREPGFYWIRPAIPSCYNLACDWELARWFTDGPDCFWCLAGEDTPYNDADLAEIDERAERPERRYSTPEQMAEAWRKITGMQQWPDPQPVTDAQKTGEEFLLWDPKLKSWDKGYWSEGHWSGKAVWMFPENYAEENEITHYLPLPPDVKP